LYSLGTTGWLNNRTPTRHGAAQSVSVFPVRTQASDLIFPAIQAARLIPSWVLLATLIVATTGICASVIAHSRVRFETASAQRERVAAEIDSLKRNNQLLQVEIKRLTTDSNTIELAARERLGMVKPDDIVIPVESITASNSGAVSFVR
jgi:cell division protein FtsB